MSSLSKRKRAKPPRLSVLEIKTLVRHRDGYRCTDCGMSARRHVKETGCNLEVHRVVPGSRYTVKGCVTVCRSCHHSKPRSGFGRGVYRSHGKAQNEIGPPIVIKLPDDVVERLKRLAKANGSTLPRIVLLILTEYLHKYLVPPSA